MFGVKNGVELRRGIPSRVRNNLCSYKVLMSLFYFHLKNVLCLILIKEDTLGLTEILSETSQIYQL